MIDAGPGSIWVNRLLVLQEKLLQEDDPKEIKYLHSVIRDIANFILAIQAQNV